MHVNKSIHEYHFIYIYIYHLCYKFHPPPNVWSKFIHMINCTCDKFHPWTQFYLRTIQFILHQSFLLMTKFIQKLRNFRWSNLIQFHVCEQFHLQWCFISLTCSIINIIFCLILLSSFFHQQPFLLFSSPSSTFVCRLPFPLLLSPCQKSPPQKGYLQETRVTKIHLHLTMYKSCHGLFLQIPRQVKSRMV